MISESSSKLAFYLTLISFFISSNIIVLALEVQHEVIVEKETTLNSDNVGNISSHQESHENKTHRVLQCNFHGQQLRVAVSPQPPLVDCEQDLFGDWNCNGSNIEVIRVLERQMNFKSSWIVLANNHYDHDHLESQIKTNPFTSKGNGRQRARINNEKQSMILEQSKQHQSSSSLLLLSSSGAAAAAAATTIDSQTDSEKLKFLAKQSGSGGIFSLVGSGRVLLSANGVMKTLDRGEEFNLTVSEPFDSFRLHFLLSKSVRDHDQIFIKPFTLNAWLAILTSAILIIPIFYLINTTSRYYFLQDDKHLQTLDIKLCLKFAHYHAKEVLVEPAATIIGNNCSLRPKRRRRRRRRRRSSSESSLSASSNDISLKQKLDKIIQEREKEKIRNNNRFFSKNLPIVLREEQQQQPVRQQQTVLNRGAGEIKRRKRLVRKQWVVERRRARRLGQMKRRKERSGFFKFAYIIWYVVASLANQGGETEDLPQASSTRILIAFWWLYLIVICAIHSGILTAILTFPKQNDFIQTLDDYLNLKQSERESIRLSVDKYSELAHLLANADNLHKSPLQQLIVEKNKEMPKTAAGKQRQQISYVNFQRHRQRILDDIQQGRGAFMEEKSTITQIISQEYYDSKQTKCLFKASRYPIDVIPMSLVMSKQMPNKCVQLINSTLRRIFKTGLAQKWRRKYESPGNDCLNSVIINAGDVDKIELKHVVLAFWLLSVGFLLGLLSLVSEIAWLFLVEDDDDDDNDEDDHDFNEINIGGEHSSSADSNCSLHSSLSSTSTDYHSSDSDQVQLGFRKAAAAATPALTAATLAQHKHVDFTAITTGAQTSKQKQRLLQQTIVIRSLQARNTQFKRIMRLTKRQQNRKNTDNKPEPKILFNLSSSDESYNVSENSSLNETKFTSNDHYEGGKKKNNNKISCSNIRIEVDESELPNLSVAMRKRRAEERRKRREMKLLQRRQRRVQKTKDFLKHLHSGQIYTNAIKPRMRRMSTALVGHFNQHHQDSNPNSSNHQQVTLPIVVNTSSASFSANFAPTQAQQATVSDASTISAVRRRIVATGGRVAPTRIN